jgi:hypothetical protein
MRLQNYLPAAHAMVLGIALNVGPLCGGAAAAGHPYIVEANEGYGLQDCLGEGGECGQVVADAWCEAHGHGPALSFGAADDITGAITTKASTTRQPSAYVVYCGD